MCPCADKETRKFGNARADVALFLVRYFFPAAGFLIQFQELGARRFNDRTASSKRGGSKKDARRARSPYSPTTTSPVMDETLFADD